MEKEQINLSDLLEGNLIVKSIESPTQQNARIARVHFICEQYGFDVLADINIWIYPVHVGEQFNCMFKRNLFSYLNPLARQLDFQYAMYGQVCRIEEHIGHEQKLLQTVYIAYDNMLICIKAEPKLLNVFHAQMNVYFVLKRNKQAIE